jgi:Cdc25 family phosphatase
VFQDRVDELAKELHDSGKQVVFHCMLSQVRGPTCAQHFAEHLAREYPQHTCSIRVMRGGYRHFLSTFAQDSVKVRQYFEDLNLDNY